MAKLNWCSGLAKIQHQQEHDVKHAFKADFGRVKIGKHKGKLYIECPLDYLRWAAENVSGYAGEQFKIAYGSKLKGQNNIKKKFTSD